MRAKNEWGLGNRLPLAGCYAGDCKLPPALPVVGEVGYLLGRQQSIIISKEALDVLKIGCTLLSRPASAMCWEV